MTRGKVLAVLFLILAAALPAAAQLIPPNDDCSWAIQVFDGVNPRTPWDPPFTNVGSTASAGVPACGHVFNRDVWFYYAALNTGTHVIHTCTPSGFQTGTLADSVLSVLDASACPPTVQLACNDDACGTLSTIAITLTAGTPYYFRVAGYGGSTGTFYLAITPPPATNDECSTAIPLAAGSNGPYPNFGATTSAGSGASCPILGVPGYNDIWFSYTAPPCSGVVEISTGCDSYDTILTAYASCGGAEVACNDDFCNLASTISFQALAGTTYLIRVATFDPNAGPSAITMHVILGGPAGMALGLNSPFGAGSLQIDIGGAPPLGSYFLAITANAGLFPNGWLYGVDMPMADLGIQIVAGWPFSATLSACGDYRIGPFAGVHVLSGIPLYAVAFGFAPGAFVHSMHTAPATHTIP
jgi:hypothetical protein